MFSQVIKHKIQNIYFETGQSRVCLLLDYSLNEFEQILLIMVNRSVS